MARPKKTKIEKEVEAEVIDGNLVVKEKPKFDPSLPESKQRDLR